MADINKKIKKIVLLKDLAEKGYWVKNITCPDIDTFENVKVDLAFGDKVIAHIVFGKLGVEIDNPDLEQYMFDISKAYRRELFKINPAIKEAYELQLAEIAKATELYRKSLIDGLNEKGFLQQDLLVKPCINNASLLDRIFAQRHGHGLAPLANPFYSKEREINSGEIFFADLNPALDGEISGKRPVLVLKVKGERLSIVPLTSKTDNSLYDDESMLLLAKESGLEKDGSVIISNLMTIHKSRLYNKAGQVSDELLNEVKNRIVESLALQQQSSNMAFEDLGELEDEFFFEKLNEINEDIKVSETLPEKDVSFAENLDDYINPEFYDKNGKEKFEVTLHKPVFITKRQEVVEEVESPKPTHVENDIPINLDAIYGGHDVHFELTDEELCMIADAFETSRPKLNLNRRNLMNGELSLGVIVGYNDGIKNFHFPNIELRVLPFSVTVVIGDKTIKQEPVTTKMLVQILSKKYPDAYPEKYILQCAKYYTKFYERTFKREITGARFAEALAMIGKKIRDPEKAIAEKTFCYANVVNIDEEFPEEDVIQPELVVEKAEEVEETPKTRTLIRVPLETVTILPQDFKSSNCKVEPNQVSGYSTYEPFYKNYTLTEKEVYSIVNEKLKLIEAKGSKKKFVNESLRISNHSDDKILTDSNDPITVYLNEGILEDGCFLTKMEIYLFHGSFWCGSKGANSDDDLQAIIVRMLTRKYPNSYPQDFAKNQVKRYNRFFVQGKMNISNACEYLDNLLSYIGKYSNNTNELVMNGASNFFFNDLLNLNQKDESEVG